MMSESEPPEELDFRSYHLRDKKMSKNDHLERLKEKLLDLQFQQGDEQEDYLRAEQILVETIMALATPRNYDLAREICDAWRDIPKWYQ